MNRLDITLEQFKKMKAMDRDEIIYQNLIHIRKQMGDYKANKTIGIAWLSLLTIWMGVKKYIGM